MSVPDLYPSVTFDGNSPEADRTINFGPLTTKKYNEYNISIVDNAGDPVTGDVPGMVSVDAWSPGSDRAETTQNAANLSTGCRKFQLFKMTVQRAVFSVTELGAGLQVVILAVRSSDAT